MFKRMNGLTLSLAGFGLAAAAPAAFADEHCGDLGDCRVYTEMNASDGDIGLHALFDGSGWTSAMMIGPGGSTVLESTLTNDANAPLEDQELTENFFESTEPPCELELDEGDGYKTLATFLAEFDAGTYTFNLNSGDEVGTAPFTHDIPAAPADVEFDGKHISWEYGEDLGECVTWPAGFEPIEEDGIIAYEVVLEPDDDDFSHFVFKTQVPASVNKITVPKEYLRALPADIPLKVEVGAIEKRETGHLFGNQTFTEEDGFCNNPSQQQCEEEDEEE